MNDENLMSALASAVATLDAEPQPLAAAMIALAGKLLLTDIGCPRTVGAMIGEMAEIINQPQPRRLQ